MSGLLARIPRKRKKEPVASVWNIEVVDSSEVTASTVDGAEASFQRDDSVAGCSNCPANMSEQTGKPSTPKSIPESQPNPHAMVSSEPQSSGASLNDLSPPEAEPNESTDHVDPMDISVSALGHVTRTILSLHLNPPKPMGNDWRGLADYMDFSNLEIDNFALREDPTREVMKQWECKTGSTIGELMRLLGVMDRDDALTALEKYIEIDVERWRKKNKNAARSDGQPLQVPEVSGTSYPNRPVCPELRGITLADHPEGPIETFDAYICHNTGTDFPFVQEILHKMEKPPYNLRFCTDWRDLVPGGSYATVTAELIENRCKRMIVVLSPEFLQSENCDFHIKFALSLSPGARSKRMVLVMLKPCDPPNILRFITVCDYTREALRPYFWPRLYAALNLT